MSEVTVASNTGSGGVQKLTCASDEDQLVFTVVGRYQSNIIQLDFDSLTLEEAEDLVKHLKVQLRRMRNA